jgi:hypothetical protein
MQDLLSLVQQVHWQQVARQQIRSTEWTRQRVFERQQLVALLPLVSCAQPLLFRVALAPLLLSFGALLPKIRVLDRARLTNGRKSLTCLCLSASSCSRLRLSSSSRRFLSSSSLFRFSSSSFCLRAVSSSCFNLRYCSNRFSPTSACWLLYFSTCCNLASVSCLLWEQSAARSFGVNSKIYVLLVLSLF